MDGCWWMKTLILFAVALVDVLLPDYVVPADPDCIWGRVHPLLTALYWWCSVIGGWCCWCC